MAFHVRDPKTDTLVRELARKRGLGLTQAINMAVANELRREDDEKPFMEMIHGFQQEVASWGKSGRKADKAFFDDMWDEG